MNDLLSAASLLLTIVGVIYGLWYGEITKAIDDGSKLPPRVHPEDRVAPVKKLCECLRSKAIPLSIASICVSLVFLPPSMALVFHFVRACFQRYDAIATSFIIVEIFSLALAYLSLHRALKLWRLTRD